MPKIKTAHDPTLAKATARSTVSKRDAFAWLCVVLCVAAFFQRVTGPITLGNCWAMLKANGFQMLAWVSVFSCLFRSDRRAGISGIDFAILAALAVGACIPSELVWVVLTGSALLIYVRAADDWQRAAATVIFALAAERLWSPMFFAAAEPYLVRLDAVFAGWTFPSAHLSRHGNIIAVGRVHAIEVLSGCSSFRNISLAILCWVAVTKWERARWKRADWMVGIAVVAAMFIANLIRLHLMASSEALYYYLHTGGGGIFATTTSSLVLAISVAGCAFASRLK